MLIKVMKFNTKAMKNLKVKLRVREKCLAEVKIQRGIFQRDTLSALIFVITTMSLN